MTMLASRVCAVCFLAIGIAMVCGLSVTILVRGLGFAAQRNLRNIETIAVNAGGNALIASRSEFCPTQVSYRSIDGKPMQSQAERDLLELAKLAAPISSEEATLAVEWRDRIAAVNDSESSSFWYLVHDGAGQTGRAKLMGYDQVSFRPVGYIGTRGFRINPLPASEEFDIDGRRAGYRSGSIANFTDYGGRVPIYRHQSLQPAGHVYVLSSGSVFDINLREKDVERLPVGDNIVSIDVGSIGSDLAKADDSSAKPRSVHSKPESIDFRRRLFLRTDSQVIVYRTQGGGELRFRIPSILTNDEFDVCIIGDDRALLIKSEMDGRADKKSLYWIDQKGQITSNSTVLCYSQSNEDSYQASNWTVAALLPSPLFYSIYATAIAPLKIQAETGATYGSALKESISAAWPQFLIISLLSLVAAWFALRIVDESCISNWLSWLIALLLLGPIGALACWLEFRKNKLRLNSPPPTIDWLSAEIHC